MSPSPPPGERPGAGDPLPRIALPGASGGIVDLTDQQLAGRTTLIWLVDRPEPGWLEQLQARLDELQALDVLSCLVTPQPTPMARPEILSMVDAGGAVARGLGLAPPALLVIDCGGRLSAIHAGADLELAVTEARRLQAATAPVLAAVQAPVLLLDAVLEPALCDELIAHWQAGEKLADGVAASGRGMRVADAQVKRRRDVVLDRMALYARFRDRVGRRVLPQIAKAFTVKITQMEAPRIGCYAADGGGWFRRHRDNMTKFTAHRLFAMSLNLNDDYEGGEVWFPEYGRQLYRPPPGGAVVFSCSLLHEVVPVRRGRRFGAFTFFHDQAGEARVQQLMAEERAAGRSGHRMQE